MGVTSITAPLGKGIVDLLEELRDRAANGEVLSLAIIVEIQGQRSPMTLMRGTYGRDPFRALAALSRAKHLVHSILDQQPFLDLR